MTASRKIACTDCNSLMNLHAFKIVSSEDRARWEEANVAGSADSVLQPDLLLEIHACPQCGHIAARPAASTPLANSDSSGS